MIRTGSVLIRPMNASDIDFVLEVENNIDIWDVSNNSSNYCRGDIERLLKDLEDTHKAKQVRYLICNTKDEIRLGTVDLTDMDFGKGVASVGILIHGLANRRKGFASRALKMIEYIALEHGITKLHAVVHQGNEPSLALFSKMNYKIVTNDLSLDRLVDDFINVEHFFKCLEK